MSAVAPISPGIADLLQVLSSAGSPLVASAGSSAALASTLQNATPGDLVQLSDQALQLQVSDGLFADSNSQSSLFSSSPSTGSTLDSNGLLLAALDSSLGITPPGSSSAPSTPAVTPGALFSVLA